MPRLTISEVIAGTGEFLTAYTWDVLIVKPPTIPEFTPDMIFKLRARAYSVSLPTKTNQVVEVNLSGYRLIQPGLNEYSGEIDLEFVEATDGSIFRLFEGWMNALFNPITGIGLPKAAVTSIVQLILLDRSHIPVGLYTLYDAFPSSFNPGADLSGDSSDPIRPTVTLSYSYYIYQPLR